MAAPKVKPKAKAKAKDSSAVGAVRAQYKDTLAMRKQIAAKKGGEAGKASLISWKRSSGYQNDVNAARAKDAANAPRPTTGDFAPGSSGGVRKDYRRTTGTPRTTPTPDATPMPRTFQPRDNDKRPTPFTPRSMPTAPESKTPATTVSERKQRSFSPPSTEPRQNMALNAAQTKTTTASKPRKVMPTMSKSKKGTAP